MPERRADRITPEGMAEDDVLAGARTQQRRTYPSRRRAGMVGDADDILRLVEALRGGGQGILQPDTVALLRHPHVGAEERKRKGRAGASAGGALLVDQTLRRRRGSSWSP